MKKYSLATSLLFLYFILAISCAHAFGVGVTPSTIEMEVQPGSHHRQILRVKNFNPEKAIRLTVSIADWTLDDNGKVQLMPPEETDYSASPWVNFSPSVLLLEPNTTRQIIVDVNTPLVTDKKGDHRTAIILSTVLPSKDQRKGMNGVWNRYQIASLFYANVLPGKSKPVITQAAFLPNDAKSTHGLNFRIENHGERHVRLEGSVGLMKEDDKELSLEESFQAVLLNDQSREFGVHFNSRQLTPGNYKVMFNIKGEGKTIPMNIAELPKLTVR